MLRFFRVASYFFWELRQVWRGRVGEEDSQLASERESVTAFLHSLCVVFFCQQQVIIIKPKKQRKKKKSKEKDLCLASLHNK